MPPTVDNTLENLVDLLVLTATRLKAVVDEDVVDTTAVAYDTQTVHFALTNQPFTFWDDPTHTPRIDQWPEFDFPELALRPNNFTGYTAPVNLTSLVSSLSGIWDWFEFGDWVNKDSVKNGGTNILAGTGHKFDQLCTSCANQTIMFPYDGCYTLERVDAFCAGHQGSEGNGDCEDGGYSDREKTQILNLDDGFGQCSTQGNLGQWNDITEDYIKPLVVGFDPLGGNDDEKHLNPFSIGFAGHRMCRMLLWKPARPCYSPQHTSYHWSSGTELFCYSRYHANPIISK